MKLLISFWLIAYGIISINGCRSGARDRANLEPEEMGVAAEYDSISVEEKLELLHKWQPQEKPLILNPKDFSPEERLFAETAANLLAASGQKICFDSQVGSYFHEHMESLIPLLPGPICGALSERSFAVRRNMVAHGTATPNYFFFPDSQFADAYAKFLANSEQHQIYSVSANRGWYLTDDKSAVRRGAHELTHGIDNDWLLYAENPPPEEHHTPLIFSKYNWKVLYGDDVHERIKRYYQLDPHKKTIIYLPTANLGEIDSWEMLDILLKNDPKLQPIYHAVLQGFIALSKSYNVIIRPHPGQDAAVKADLARHFAIAPPSLFKSFVPFYSVVDLVIATPGGGGSTATSQSQVPLVLLTPDESWGEKRPYQKRRERQSVETTLGERHALMQNDHDINLPNLVEKALSQKASRHPDYLLHVENRRRYFAHRFGCIDGYENLRVAIKILADLDIDVTPLVSIYKTLPLYQAGKEPYGNALCSKVGDMLRGVQKPSAIARITRAYSL